MEENQVSDLGTGAADMNVQTPNDKGFSRDQVSKIVNAEKNKAVDAVRRELEQKYQRELEQANASKASAYSQSPVDTDAIYQKVREKFNQDRVEDAKRQQQENYKNFLTEAGNKFHTKLTQGKSAYSDFDNVVGDFNPSEFPELTILLSDTDNAEHILYEISKNPIKMAGLDRLAERSPKQARAAMAEIANSIMSNRQAQADAQGQQTAPPLDRLQSSGVSGSNGNKTISSLRSEPWLKG